MRAVEIATRGPRTLRLFPCAIALALAGGCASDPVGPEGDAGSESTVPCDSVECPELPVAWSERGRDIVVEHVELNGVAEPVAVVAPGSNVELRVQGSWTSTGEDCPGCVTQFYARIDGVTSLCLGSNVRSVSFDEQHTFQAPSAPGVYFVNLTSSFEFSCLDTTDAPNTFGPSTIATLVVE